MKHTSNFMLSLFLGMALLTAQATPLAADPRPVPAGDDTGKPDKLRKRGPAHCTATDDIVLDKVIIDTEDFAVKISGSCDIVIKNSVIKAGKHGLLIEGSGDIEVVNSTIEGGISAITIRGSGDISLTGTKVAGKKAALTIDGSGDIEAKDTHFRGRKVIRGTGEYKDRGGNTWEK